MDASLYKDLHTAVNKEEKIKERRKKFLQFSKECGILIKEIQERITALDKTKEADYEKASWAYLQAHRNGKKQAYEELLSLLTI